MANHQTTSKDGGCCIYASYEGNAKIFRVSQTPTSLAQAKIMGGPGYEGYEVWFRFIPKSDVPDDRIKQVISREHLFTLYNSWYAGPRYLEKYGIREGKIYPCTLNIIEEGTATPVIFEFETIDTRDYFETRSKVKKQKALPKLP